MPVPPVVIAAVATAVIEAVAGAIGKNQDRKAEEARLAREKAEAQEERSRRRWKAAFIGLATLMGVLAVVVVVWMAVM